MLEDVLRLVAKVENIELDRFDARYLIKKLTSEGVLSREQYHSLMAIAPFRSAIAHGFHSSHLTKQTVFDLLELANQLLEDLEGVRSHSYHWRQPDREGRSLRKMRHNQTMQRH